jgi:CheY-like chemotaxis protein
MLEIIVHRSQTGESGPVVLLVQPESDDRDMYAEFLRYRRFHPVIAATVSDALKLAPGSDVIVTGISLPGGSDGFELITQLRRDQRTKTTPIIVLTATMMNAVRERSARLGCNAFLRKPCLPDALVREVRRVLSMAQLRMRPKPLKSEPRKSTRTSRRPR